MTEFKPFAKIARYSRGMVVTEKIDGTNAQVFIGEDGEFLIGSRTRWITPEADNFGFAKWAIEHKEELLQLGPGQHFGEWWGAGIQRRYGLTEKRFSLFNVGRWRDDEGNTKPELPCCCGVVPVLYRGPISDSAIAGIMDELLSDGSQAAPGFMEPEGIVIFHTAARVMFKKTLKNDEGGKGQE